jgi:hypothetical protein
MANRHKTSCEITIERNGLLCQEKKEGKKGGKSEFWAEESLNKFEELEKDDQGSRNL